MCPLGHRPRESNHQPPRQGRQDSSQSGAQTGQGRQGSSQSAARTGQGRQGSSKSGCPQGKPGQKGDLFKTLLFINLAGLFGNIWQKLTLRSLGAIPAVIEWPSVATMANIRMFSHQNEPHLPQFGELRSFRAILKYEPTQINRSNFTFRPCPGRLNK